MIQKLDKNGNYVDEPIIVDIVRDDGSNGEDGIEGILDKGTPLSIEMLNEIIEHNVLTEAQVQQVRKLMDLQSQGIVATDIDGNLESLSPSDARTRIELDKAANVPGFAVTTETPTAPNTSGVRVCYLEQEPPVKYEGWLYLIKKV